MTIQFKHFMMETFKTVIEGMGEHKDAGPAAALALFRFKQAYIKEATLFSERWAELTKDMEEKLKATESEEEKDKITEEVNKKAQELLDCESELKPLDYKKIEKIPMSGKDLEILHPVLTNLPE